MRGLGVDLVSLPEFAAQVREPGSAFLSGVLTPREARRVRARAAATSGAQPGSARYDEAVARHAGGLWAAKEAFIKAWSSLYYGREDPLERDQVNWAEIEVVNDRWGRPSLRFHGAIATALKQTEREISASLTWLVSLSHDGNYAIAWIHAYPSKSHSLTDFS